MRALLVVAGRAFGRMAGQATSAFAVAAFLAAAGALFAKSLLDSEGAPVSVASLWAVSASQALPLLTSLLTMRLWDGDGDRSSAEIDLVAPVAERTFAAGRLLGAYVAVALAVAVSFCLPAFALPWLAPSLAPGLTALRLCPAFVALCAYALPLAAVGSLAAAALRRPAPAAVASLLVAGVAPRALYLALEAWSPLVRRTSAEMPIDAIVADAADGGVSLCALAVAVAVAAFSVFASSKAFAMRRLVGDGRLALKATTVLSVACALLATALFSVCAWRFMDIRLCWPEGSGAAVFSARTREILSDMPHEALVTVCLRRNDPRSAAVKRLLGAFSAESRALAGAGVRCEFVDPRWDVGADRLAGMGLAEGYVAFSAERRPRIVLPVDEIDERACATAMQRLSMPRGRGRVLFTAGHGEPDVADGGRDGASDAVRALRQDGHVVESLFCATSPIPQDCSVLVVSGAKVPLSLAERKDVERFIAQGGHLLATVSGDASAGVGPLLGAYGISVHRAEAPAHTVGGADVVAAEFGGHAISDRLLGTVVSFAPGSVWFGFGDSSAGGEGGFSFTPLCMSGGQPFAVAAEKGSYLKSDLAIRPARIVLIGDGSFLRNSSLASRANANRNLLLNSVAWLAGIDVPGSADISGNVLVTNLDRGGRVRLAVVAALCLPAAAAMLALACVAWKRRHP